jgi:DNA-binding transcriptional MerR regulator
MLIAVDALLTIGEFSKMTYLSVKALRHYHDVGLLEPAAVDPVSGYRRYASSQVATAQLIRRFRDLDMPLDEVRQVLQAPDLAARNRALLVHLERLQQQLERTELSVASLQELLTNEPRPVPDVELRRLPAIRVVATHAIVDFAEAAAWLEPAFADLHGSIDSQGIAAGGPDGALYSDEFFEESRGEVTAFVPVSGDAADVVALPATSAAVLVHDGPFVDLDQAYGALGAVVAERGIGGPGPIREHYLAPARTEVCWPITPGGTQ